MTTGVTIDGASVPRLPSGVKLRFETSNVSQGGVFIESDLLYEEGEIIWFSFTLPGAMEILRGWLGDHLAGQMPVAVGHRVVHGGPRFDRPVLVDADVLGEIGSRNVEVAEAFNRISSIRRRRIERVGGQATPRGSAARGPEFRLPRTVQRYRRS